MELTNYLLTELQCVRMIGPQEFKGTKKVEEDDGTHTKEEKDLSRAVNGICDILNMQSANHGPKTLTAIYSDLEVRIKQTGKHVEKFVSRPVLQISEMATQQWELITDINKDLAKDYSARKDMLYVRLNATLTSMKKGEKIGENAATKKDIAKIYDE
eukprot:UN33879